MTGLWHDAIRAPQAAMALASLLLLLLSGLYALLWWRDRERGMSWLAAALLLLALWAATDPLHVPAGPYVSTVLWAQWLLTLGIFLTVIGVVTYLQVPPRWRWPLIAILTAPNIGVVLVLSAGVPVLRTVGVLMTTWSLAGLAILAWTMRKREPGAGHGFIAVTLLLIPFNGVLMAAVGFEPVLLRYSAVPPLLTFFITLLTVSLLRRRRALEAEVARRQLAEQELTGLNQSLEARVVQRTAELQAMVAGLESFNRNVSHDLRGPLGGMSGLAGLAITALARGEQDTVHNMLGAIQRQAQASTDLVASMLELARVGQIEPRHEPVDLTALATEVVGQLQTLQAEPHRARIIVEPMPQALGDAALLRPALVNLIGNALKFSRHRDQPVVRISSEPGPQTGELTLSVRDNGMGFDPAKADQLFEPFQRLHGAQIEGHGVGLSIVRRAVERQGGRLNAEGLPDQGACFRISLPAATRNASEIASPAD